MTCRPTVLPSVHAAIWQSGKQAVRQSFRSAIMLSDHPSIHPSIRLSDHPSIHPSIHQAMEAASWQLNFSCQIAETKAWNRDGCCTAAMTSSPGTSWQGRARNRGKAIAGEQGRTTAVSMPLHEIQASRECGISRPGQGNNRTLSLQWQVNSDVRGTGQVGAVGLTG